MSPFKSKAQLRKFGAMERRGQIPKGTTSQWAHETKSIKRLPERKPSRGRRGGY